MRVVSSAFDQGFADFRISAGQFTILMTLARAGPLSIGALAGLLSMDTTTLTRVLKLPLTNGHVHIERGSDRRVKVVSISTRGCRLLERAMPNWCEAQRRALALIPGGRWNHLRRRLGSLRRGLRPPAVATVRKPARRTIARS
jgi:DNA-binding MarR family transcriptional regulator